MRSFLTFLLISISIFSFKLSECFSSSNITDSFSAYPVARGVSVGIRSRGVLGTDKYLVSIHKAALGKEFILKSNVIFLDVVQNFSSLKTRIVSFRQTPDRLFMTDVTGHNSFSKDLPQNIILTSFKIVQETSDEIFFDFNQGMSQLFIASEWKASDFEGDTYSPDYQSVDVSQSYLEDIQVNSEKNRLYIRQIAQLPLSFFFLNLNLNVEVRYYLEPYAENQGFTKVKTADFRKFGFFEVTPHLDPDHDSTIYATKFDERKPIVFAVSSNTPEEYRDAVKDGILYFNKILGAGKIQVMMAPQDVTAPHPDYNVVQWIEWDGAGFAYADAQADPRTGQTLHGQVFFTSAFVAGSRAGVRRLLRRLDVENESALPKKVLIGLKGMEPQPRCRYEIHENHKNELIGLLSLNASDALILKASQDYVREVVAHEVGHVLGLRHNFAGSHGGTYKVEERDGLFQNYLKDQKTPDHIVPTSSVMDYNDFFEAAMSGDIIADKTRTAFSYDTKALQYLYLGTNVEIEDVPLFCTDSHLDENFDYEECMMFDVGPSRLAWAAYDTEKYLEGLPYQVMESFIRFKAPVKGLEPASVESFNLSAQTLAQSTYLLRPFIVDSLTQNAKLLSVRRLQPSITSWNKNEIESMEKETLQQEILSLGGLSALLQQVPQNFGETAYDKFVELTKKDQYRKGVGLAGQNYEFSDTEISSMKRIAKKIFDQLEEALVKTEARSLIPSKGPFVNHPISEPMAELMQKRIEKLLLSVKEGESKAYRAQVLSKKKNENDVQRLVWMSFELPTFKYSVDTRSVAKDMLTDTRGLALGWNWKALEALGATVPDFYNKPLQGYGFSDFNVKKVPQGMALWLNENSAFAALFSHVPVESCLVPSLLKDWLGDSGEEKKRGGLLY